jgi:hypothetical protein
VGLVTPRSASHPLPKLGRSAGGDATETLKAGAMLPAMNAPRLTLAHTLFGAYARTPCLKQSPHSNQLPHGHYRTPRLHSSKRLFSAS